MWSPLGLQNATKISISMLTSRSQTVFRIVAERVRAEVGSPVPENSQGHCLPKKTCGSWDAGLLKQSGDYLGLLRLFVSRCSAVSQAQCTLVSESRVTANTDPQAAESDVSWNLAGVGERGARLLSVVSAVGRGGALGYRCYCRGGRKRFRVPLLLSSPTGQRFD